MIYANCIIYDAYADAICINMHKYTRYYALINVPCNCRGMKILMPLRMALDKKFENFLLFSNCFSFFDKMQSKLFANFSFDNKTTRKYVKN